MRERLILWWLGLDESHRIGIKALMGVVVLCIISILSYIGLRDLARHITGRVAELAFIFMIVCVIWALVLGFRKKE